MRQRYGDNWLNSGASDTLHNLLGINQSEARIGEAVQSEAEAVITSEKVTPVRRSSDEVPDAIDKVEDENRTIKRRGRKEEEKRIRKRSGKEEQGKRRRAVEQIRRGSKQRLR